MKMGIATRSLLAILCFTLSAPAFAQIIFTSGPPSFTNGFFVTGPNLPNFHGTIQDISDEFTTTSPGGTTEIEWAEWSVGTPTSFAWSLSTDSSGAFTQNLGNATVAQYAGNTHLLKTVFGYGVYDVTATFSDIDMPIGTYWLTISNATDAASDGTQAWDVNNYDSVVCNYRLSGTPPLACGSGTTQAPPQPQSGEGEAFTISGSQATTPEPSSIMLFGSGVLGLFGILRRKLNT